MADRLVRTIERRALQQTPESFQSILRLAGIKSIGARGKPVKGKKPRVTRHELRASDVVEIYKYYRLCIAQIAAERGSIARGSWLITQGPWLLARSSYIIKCSVGSRMPENKSKV